MKFQNIILMIQHTFKSLKFIKFPTACFTVIGSLFIIESFNYTFFIRTSKF